MGRIFPQTRSEKTHPQPDKDSRFYYKFKPEISLHSSTTYRKHREKLLDWNKMCTDEVKEINSNVEKVKIRNKTR